jgi:hypothetical protein
VGIVGYRGTAIQGIRVAANIDAGLVVDGARCVVVFNDVYSVADAVVVAVWG